MPHIEEYGKAETEISKLNAELPEQMKKSILQWAIQGRLVPQDPTDEPASELLKRIKAEKSALIKSGKLKPDKHESVIVRNEDGRYLEKKDGKSTDITDEIPFDIPDTWEWVRLRCIAYLQNGYAFKSEDMKIDGEIPVIRISNLQNNIACLDKSLYVSENPVLSDFLISEDDLLIAMSGATTGKLGVYKSTKKAYLNQRVGNIKLYYKTKEIQNYQYYFFLSQQKRIFDMAYGGAQPNISGNMICDLLFPLPPLAEQNRIVVKLESILSAFGVQQKTCCDTLAAPFSRQGKTP